MGPAAGAIAIVRGVLAVFAVYYVGLGLWMAVSPETFYTALGPFGTRNDHYLRDMATFEIAIGFGLGHAPFLDNPDRFTHSVSELVRLVLDETPLPAARS
jgi:hypothetical protein